MRKFILAILLLLSFQVSAQVSREDMIEVYSTLIITNNLKNAPHLTIINSEDDNAYSYLNQIGITTGMLKALNNREELARVLGHELGHYYLHHNGSTPTHEFQADAQASRYMKKAHYKVCKGAKYLARRNSEGGMTHPSDADRYKALGCR